MAATMAAAQVDTAQVSSKGAGCHRWKTRRPDNDRISCQIEGKGDHSRLGIRNWQ